MRAGERLGHAVPGNGVQSCSSGSVDETVSESTPGGERVVTLTAGQCFDARSDSVQNGRLSLRLVPLDSGRIEGNLSDGGAVFAVAQPADGDVHRFRQARGAIALLGEANGESGSATMDGLSLILGSGPRPPDSTPLTLTRQMEVRAGAPALEQVIQNSRIGTLVAVGASGRFVIRGSGLAQEAACVLAAGFDAHTSSALQFGAVHSVPRGAC